MRLFLLLAMTACLSGCAGSGEGGSWTPQDTAAAMGTINTGLNTYDRYQHPEYYRPQPLLIP